jgi:signal transduction histidine kinase
MRQGSPQRSDETPAATLLHRARGILRADGLFLVRADRGSGPLRLVGSAGLKGRARRLLEDNPPRTIEALLGQGPERPDPPASPSWQDLAGALSVQAVPVRGPRGAQGCLVLFRRSPAHPANPGSAGAPALPGVPPLSGAPGPATASTHNDGPALRVLAESLGQHLGRDGAVRGKRLERIDHLRIFYRVSVLASARRGPSAIGEGVLREFCRALGLTRAEIWVLEDRGRWMRPLCGRGTHPVRAAAPDGDDVSPRAFALTRRLLRRRQPLLEERIGQRPAARSFCPLGWSRLTSLYCLPLRRQGRYVGFLFADRGGPTFDVSPADRVLSAALGGLIAEVLDGAQAWEIEERRHRQLVLLNRVNQEVAAEERLNLLLPRLTRLVRETEDRCHGVVLGLYETGAREIAVRAIAGPNGRRFLTYRFPVRRSQPATCLGSQAFLRQRPVRVEDASSLPRASLYWPESRSVLVAPIRSMERALGVLRLEALPRRTFDEGDAEVYAILGEQIGHAIERSRTLEDLRRRQQDLQTVSENLEAMLEGDRRRFARELHEELAQSLSAARMHVGLVRHLIRPSRPEVEAALGSMSRVLEHTIEETRRIASDLRPVMLDDLGLMPTLRWYADAFARRTGIRVSLRPQGDVPEIRNEPATLLFRFVQEAFGRIERQGSARRALVSLSATGPSVRLVVWDDGQVRGTEAGQARGAAGATGAAWASGAAGAAGDDPFLSMRERIERAGGVFTADARSGLGTRLIASLPFLATTRERGRGAVRPHRAGRGGGVEAGGGAA